MRLPPRPAPAAEPRLTDIAPRVAAALARRAGLLADPQTTCCRLIHDAPDGLPGLVAERFGKVVVLQDRGLSAAVVEAAIAALADQLGPGGPHDVGLSAIYAKPFARDRSHAPDDKAGPLYNATPAWGTPAEPQFTVLENGLAFQVRPYDGYAVGLFLDQRLNRAAVRQGAADLRVLNTFCYTGAFSVAALAGGARRVVSVDVSKKYLAWARENCALLEPSARRCEPEFFAIGTFDFFRAGRKRGEQYDRIILDPPSFARDKRGTPFSAEHDYARLLQEAWDLLAPGGELWACTNHARIDQGRFDRLAATALSVQRPERLVIPPPPPDFPGSLPPIRTLRLRKA